MKSGDSFIMDMFDNIIKKLTDAADYTLKEAGKLTDTAKIKFAIATKEAAIEEEYQTIGKYSYADYTDPTSDNKDAIHAACEEIDKLIKEVNVLKSELAVHKKFKNCTECGTKIDKDMAYCYKCGHQQ